MNLDKKVLVRGCNVFIVADAKNDFPAGGIPGVIGGDIGIRSVGLHITNTTLSRS